MADWTTLGAGLVGATAAIAGSLGGQVFRGRSDMSRDNKERHLRFRDNRRSAYAELLSISSRLISLVEVGRSDLPPADLDSLEESLHSAEAMAELYATPETWTEMEGIVRIARLKASISGEGDSPDVCAAWEQELQSMGADTPTGVRSWRARYVQAALTDLAT